MIKSVVITIPHSIAPTPENLKEANEITGYHSFDFVAEECSKQLTNNLRHLGMTVYTFPANINRVKLDLNRPWSRSQPNNVWRAKVRECVQQLVAADCPPIVIDMHSFPGVYLGFEGVDAMVLTPGHPKVVHTQIITRANQGRLGLAVSPSMSDVAHEYESMGIPSIMFEMSEGSDNTNMLMSIATAIHTVCNEISSAQLVLPYETKPVGMFPCYYVDANNPGKRIQLYLHDQIGRDRAQCVMCGKPATKSCLGCNSVMFCDNINCQDILWRESQHWISCPLLEDVTACRHQHLAAVKLQPKTMPPEPKMVSCRAIEINNKCSCCPNIATHKCDLCLVLFCQQCDAWKTHCAIHETCTTTLSL